MHIKDIKTLKFQGLFLINKGWVVLGGRFVGFFI